MKVQITDLARDSCLAPFHISASNAIAAVTHHDAMERVDLGGAGGQLFFFTKSTNGHTLLVQAQGSEAELKVMMVLKVPHDVMAVAGSDATPLKILQTLADRFGCVIRVGSRSAKFILDEKIPHESGDLSRLVQIESMPSGGFIQSMMLRIDKDDRGQYFVNVGLCFALDRDAYLKAIGA